MSAIPDRFSFLFERRPRRSRLTERPERQHGTRHSCSRCGEVFRIFVPDLYYAAAPVLCGSCVQDDLIEATTRCPRPRLYGQDVEMARWEIERVRPLEDGKIEVILAPPPGVFDVD